MREALHGDTVISLLGKPLEPPVIAPADRRKAEELLEQARRRFEDDPDLDNTIWYGRRMGYLYRFQDSIHIYSEGISRFPTAYQLYRHRGHRYISTRQLALATADFEQSAELAKHRPVEVEPDGLPNWSNTPRSTGHFNVWYHLGLAYYLSGAFHEARLAYETCLGYCDNDDSLTATIDWLYMTYRRIGEDGLAAQLLERIAPVMDLVEDTSYHRRLLLYKGLLSPDELLSPPQDAEDPALAIATQGYGVGNWYLSNDNAARAFEIFASVLETPSWSAFGYIASEVELARRA
jgi:tetratricopeptide (TPR) repeat protein